MTLMPAGGRIPEWTLADRLRKARESAGYEQIAFAQATSMARATISAAENGHRQPTKANLRLWAMATGVPLEWLTTGVVPNVSPDPDGWAPRGSNPRPADYRVVGSRPIVALSGAAA